jgi:hypothetical protein
MNYIKQLECQKAELQDQLISRAERIQELREYLASAKFNYDPADGSRTDWIATKDVLRWLQYIEEPVEEYLY